MLCISVQCKDKQFSSRPYLIFYIGMTLHVCDYSIIRPMQTLPIASLQAAPLHMYSLACVLYTCQLICSLFLFPFILFFFLVVSLLSPLAWRGKKIHERGLS